MIHSRYLKATSLTGEIIGAAIEVHRLQGHSLDFEEPLRFDMFVEGCVLIEPKAVKQVLLIHRAQLMSDTKRLNVPLELLINFHELKFVDGVYRMMFPGADGKL